MTEQEFAYLSNRIRGKLTKLALRFNRVLPIWLILSMSLTEKVSLTFEQ